MLNETLPITREDFIQIMHYAMSSSLSLKDIEDGLNVSFTSTSSFRLDNNTPTITLSNKLNVVDTLVHLGHEFNHLLLHVPYRIEKGIWRPRYDFDLTDETLCNYFNPFGGGIFTINNSFLTVFAASLRKYFELDEGVNIDHMIYKMEWDGEYDEINHNLPS